MSFPFDPQQGLIIVRTEQVADYKLRLSLSDGVERASTADRFCAGPGTR